MMDLPEEFDWDQGNETKSWLRHGVATKESEEIFFNKPLSIGDDPGHSKIEKRFAAYGKTDKERLLFVVFVVRRDKIRIVSARDQNKRERRFYENLKNKT